jgi:hypothetical protein
MHTKTRLSVIKSPFHRRANGAERLSERKTKARVLIPPSYLPPGKETLAKSKVHQ